ncbi:TetR/AcrR family transcriptional regulator [Brachybacterium massiliense]|uniref:TetR/AcrR family transcriptional regulator n=1 Tax=Brachybacterium massiliense TaxID=1755098 RepID=A0A921MXN9_9MICO|nr:TetR/AcrR family transcriptional regulator [Brachybacterium massiliense]HJG92275.1 TetR/AcrR family transcriptional regulator [Brachybacterium massiliense]
MPKIIGGSLEEHRERTREKIFAALAELLETQSFESVTFSKIAAAAEVGRTAMYNHFPDRETLLVEYAIYETTDYIAQLRAGVSDSATPRDAVIAYIHTQLDLNVSFHVPQTSGGATLSPATAARMRDHVVMIEDVLRTIVADGVASGDFAEDIDVGATVRIINGLLVGSSAKRYSRTALEAFVLRGLGAQR